MPVIRLPAQRLARAWAAVFNAAGTVREVYHLYRAVTVEVFPGEGGGVRLVCSNGSLLLRCWVPEYRDVDDDGQAVYDEPALDVEPAHTIVATDIAKRAHSLMGFLGQVPVEGEDDGRTDIVELTVGRIEHDQLTLEGLGETWGLLITAPREQQCIPLLGGTPVVWRHYYDEFAPESVRRFRFSQKNLRALAAVKGEAGDVEMIPQGDNRPFLVKVDTVADVVWGVLMPLKADTSPDVEDIDDPADDPRSFLDDLDGR